MGVKGLVVLACLLGAGEPSFAQVAEGISTPTSNSLGTLVNNGSSCTSGICTITGGTVSGNNQFYRFQSFVADGAITSVDFQGNPSNVIAGVLTNAIINRPLQLQNPGNLFILSPAGISVGSGGAFSNVNNLLLTTATGLGIASTNEILPGGVGLFDAVLTDSTTVSALDGAPLISLQLGWSGLQTNDSSLQTLRLTSNGDLEIAGGLLTVDQALLLNAQGGNVMLTSTELRAPEGIDIYGNSLELNNAVLRTASGSSVYQLTEVTGSWEQAQANAEALGGNLVTVNNQAENQALIAEFGKGYWIGFNDVNQEGVWEWVSGEPVTYTDWGAGEPNNNTSQGAGGQDWAWISTNSYANGSTWDDCWSTCSFKGLVEISTLNQTGGSVLLEGNTISLVSSTIDVSGGAGGGSIYIGGGILGEDLAISNATTTSIDPTSKLLADATASGTGGLITVHADQTLNLNGLLSAQGGPLGGNGGLIYTSAPSIFFEADLDLTTDAVLGSLGNWSIELADLAIQEANLSSSANSITALQLSSFLDNSNVHVSAVGATSAAVNGDFQVLPTGDIASGYLGLAWDNFAVLLSVDNEFSGYDILGSLTSPDGGGIVAFNKAGTPATVISLSGDFNFDSALFAAAWNNDLNLLITAYDDGAMVGTAQVVLNPSPASINLALQSASGVVSSNFSGTFSSIDRVDFESFGGVDALAADGGSGTQFATDNWAIVGIQGELIPQALPISSSGFISASAPVTWNGASSLSLTAVGDIELASQLVSSGSGSLFLEASGNILAGGSEALLAANNLIQVSAQEIGSSTQRLAFSGLADITVLASDNAYIAYLGNLSQGLNVESLNKGIVDLFVGGDLLPSSGGYIKSPGGIISLDVSGFYSQQGILLDASTTELGSPGGQIFLDAAAISISGTDPVTGYSMNTSGDATGGLIAIGTRRNPSSVSLINASFFADPPATGGNIQIFGTNITSTNSTFNVTGESGGSIQIGNSLTSNINIQGGSFIGGGGAIFGLTASSITTSGLSLVGGALTLTDLTPDQLYETILQTSFTQTPLNEQELLAPQGDFTGVPLNSSFDPQLEPAVATTLEQSSFLYAEDYFAVQPDQGSQPESSSLAEQGQTAEPSSDPKEEEEDVNVELELANQQTDGSTTSTQTPSDSGSSQVPDLKQAVLPQTAPQQTAPQQTTQDQSVGGGSDQKLQPDQAQDKEVSVELELADQQTTPTLVPSGSAPNPQPDPAVSSAPGAAGATPAASSSTEQVPVNPAAPIATALATQRSAGQPVAAPSSGSSAELRASVTTVSSAEASERFSQGEARAQSETAEKLGLAGGAGTPPTPAQIQGLLQRVMQSLRGPSSSSR